MTPHPEFVGVGETLEAAAAIMSKAGIRHLPVVQDEKLQGILSDRDVKLARSFKHANPRALTVADVFESDVYVTHPDSNLKQVVDAMAEKRIGSAVVVEGETPVGIFTTTDACRVLGSLLA
jgi:CBS domain-containing protein